MRILISLLSHNLDSFWWIPISKIAESYCKFYFSLWMEIPYYFPQHCFILLSHQQQRVLISSHPYQCSSFLYNNHSEKYEMISHCGFDLHRTGYGTTDWFQIGKGVRQGCILSPCLFKFCAEYIMRNTGLEEAQAGMKIAGRNINNLRYADDTTLWQIVKRN